MSGLAGREPGSHGPTEERPRAVSLNEFRHSGTLALPGLEEALKLGLVSSTAEFKKLLIFDVGLTEEPSSEQMVRLALAFSRGAVSVEARELSLELCRKLDPDGVFSQGDLDRKILAGSRTEISLQHRVKKLIDCLGPDSTPSERVLAAEQLDLLLEPKAGASGSGMLFQALVFGQNFDPEKASSEHVDRLDRLIAHTSSVGVRQISLELKNVIVARLEPASPASKSGAQEIGAVAPLHISRRPALTFLGGVPSIKSAREFELLIEGSYFLLGEPVRGIEDKIVATSVIETQFFSNPHIINLARELRVNLIERWLAPGQLRSVNDLKELMFPSNYPIIIDPPERLDRATDLVARAESAPVARLAMHLRSDVLPCEHKDFALRRPGNLETMLFTDQMGRWLPIGARTKIELINQFASAPENKHAEQLAKQLRAHLLNAHQHSLAPDKQALQRCLFGEGADYLPAEEVRQALRDLITRSSNQVIRRFSQSLLIDLDQEQKSLWAQMRRSKVVGALYRWLNRD